jgi:hypothetical protein
MSSRRKKKSSGLLTAGNNSGRFDGQTAWRLAPATGRAAETIDCGLINEFLEFLF